MLLGAAFAILVIIRSLAWAELYLTLAAVIHRFDLQLYQTEMRDVKPRYDHFVPFPETNNGVRVLVT
jgi:hypothetical protein